MTPSKVVSLPCGGMKIEISILLTVFPFQTKTDTDFLYSQRLRRARHSIREGDWGRTTAGDFENCVRGVWLYYYTPCIIFQMPPDFLLFVLFLYCFFLLHISVRGVCGANAYQFKIREMDSSGANELKLEN